MRAMKFIVPFFALLVAFAPAQAKEEAPMTVDGATTVSVQEARAMFDAGVVFVDVRGGAGSSQRSRAGGRRGSG